MEGDQQQITPEMERLLRAQRHDFINYIQVLHSYLQMGKTEKAKLYLDNMVHEINAGTFCAQYIPSLLEKRTERKD